MGPTATITPVFSYPLVERKGLRINREILRGPIPMPTAPAHLIFGPLHHVLGLASQPKSKTEKTIIEMPARESIYKKEKRKQENTAKQSVSNWNGSMEKMNQMKMDTRTMNETTFFSNPNTDTLSVHSRFVAPSMRNNTDVVRARELLEKGLSRHKLGNAMGGKKKANRALKAITAASNRKKWHDERNN